ncbi:hypothetical protein N9R79_09745, partial [Vibrio sp.]|nr:hypothetical protein [Vibrio sp.]
SPIAFDFLSKFVVSIVVSNGDGLYKKVPIAFYNEKNKSYNIQFERFYHDKYSVIDFFSSKQLIVGNFDDGDDLGYISIYVEVDKI